MIPFQQTTSQWFCQWTCQFEELTACFQVIFCAAGAVELQLDSQPLDSGSIPVSSLSALQLTRNIRNMDCIIRIWKIFMILWLQCDCTCPFLRLEGSRRFESKDCTRWTCSMQLRDLRWVFTPSTMRPSLGQQTLGWCEDALMQWCGHSRFNVCAQETLQCSQTQRQLIIGQALGIVK